jgi:type I restriction enzyme M protein
MLEALRALVLETHKRCKEISKANNARVRDIGILQTKIERMDALLEAIGGMGTAEESQMLILKKHFDIINDQLQRYLNVEKRTLIPACENIFNKYYTSIQAIEQKRESTIAERKVFLTHLN